MAEIMVKSQHKNESEIKNKMGIMPVCWVYEATPELLDAFDRILKEGEKND